VAFSANRDQIGLGVVTDGIAPVYMMNVQIS
jgi:hypothetical protein